MLLYECIGKNVLHVTCIEIAVCDIVVRRIDLRIFNRFRNIFDSNDF